MRDALDHTVLCLMLTTYCAVGTRAESNSDRESLQKTSEAIRAAFAHSDVDGIMVYHHPT